MQSLFPILAVLASIVTIVAGLAGGFKWLGQRISAWTRKPSEDRYTYGNLKYKKDRFTFTGYVVFETDEGERLPYAEAVDSILTLNPGNAPDKRVKQHVEAVQRLMDRIRADGWEYVGHSDLKDWYAYRFRQKDNRQQD